MNSNWRNRPTTIDFIDRNRIDAIINIDESGNANLKQVVKAKHAGTPPADSEKHFTVTACVISMADFAEARDMVMALKISTGLTVYTLIREFKNESASIHAKFVVVKMRSIRILLIINLLWMI